MSNSKWKLTLVAALLVCLASAGPALAASKPLKLAFIAPTPVWGPIADHYAREVAKLAPGLSVKSYGGGQLGPAPQNFAEVKLGKLDMMLADVGLLAMPKGGKDFSILFSPYVFNSQAHMHKFFASDLFKKMLAKTEKQAGFKFLGLVGDRSPRVISTSNRKVEKPADMKGLKLRVQLIPPIMATLKAWGATPIPLSAAEMYMAMKQGTVDGQDNGFDAIYGAKFYEVQKYVSPIDYIRSALMLIISDKVWKKLSPAEQKALLAACATTEKWATARNDVIVAKSIKGVREKGMIVLKPDMQAFRKSVAKAVKEDMDGKLWPAGLYHKINTMK